MSTTTNGARDANPSPNQKKANLGPEGVERRRRRRAKISAQVHVRTANSAAAFDEVCKTIDVSRDGLLFVTPHAGYWQGQPLHVTFPYSTDASALNQAQPAEVVRVYEDGQGQYGIAVEFAAAKKAREQSNAGSSGALGTASAGRPPAAVVLAIEPDESIANGMRNLLQQDGYTVVIVATAQAALDVLKTTVPVVFITEAETPDINGQDLCLIIRRNERLHHVPVILLTPSAQAGEYAASRELGAVVCVTKPFSLDRLLQVVRLVAPPPSTRSVYGARLQPSALERSL